MTVRMRTRVLVTAVLAAALAGGLFVAKKRLAAGPAVAGLFDFQQTAEMGLWGAGTRWAQKASPKLPAFVEDNYGEALLSAIPPPYVPVSKSTAIGAAEKFWPVPSGAYVTAGFYVAKVSHEGFWVVVYHDVNVPISVGTRGVWHTSYMLVDVFTGRVTDLVD